MEEHDQEGGDRLEQHRRMTGGAQLLEVPYPIRAMTIPCNTAHAPEIFDVIRREAPPELHLLHMIEETAAWLQRQSNLF